MSKLSDIAATLATLSKQFAELSLEQSHTPNPERGLPGMPIPPARREEIKAQLRLNAKSARPIPMLTLAKHYSISRPTLYQLKKEIEKEKPTPKGTP